MKRVLALFCAFLLLLGATACDKKVSEEDYYENALTALEKGDFREAYRLLTACLAVCDNLDAAALRDKIVFMPIMTEQTAPDGSHQRNTFRYDSKGMLLQVDGNVGEQQRTLREYTYDENGRLMSVKSGDGTVIYYIYDGEGNRTTMQIDIAGYVTQVHYTYDEQGRCLAEKQTDPSGSTQAKTYRYDEGGNKVFERTDKFDKSYEQFTYRYDGSGNMTYLLQEKSNGDRCEITYTYVGNVRTQMTESNGSTTVYTYDENGNCLTETVTSAHGNILVTTYTYDENDHCLWAENADGKRTYTYDAYGNKLSETYVDRQNREFVWRFEWKPFYYPEGVIEEWEAIRSEAAEDHDAIIP